MILRHRNVDIATVEAFEAAVKAALPPGLQLLIITGVILFDARPVRAYELIADGRRSQVDLRMLADVLGVHVPEILR